ncbi:hypothetical protein RvY_00457 [Ramazzottius varieornatus]|uniref:Uncharacterized protein n=1 Tax=Ramazzottius varieornatus TaxID=947166 RepID=A0A1D1UDT3_RAMVA|nr:hypothetical protein RvY_00457 [Ramazzottius varieornatus]
MDLKCYDCNGTIGLESSLNCDTVSPNKTAISQISFYGCMTTIVDDNVHGRQLIRAGSLSANATEGCVDKVTKQNFNRRTCTCLTSLCNIGLWDLAPPPAPVVTGGSESDSGETPQKELFLCWKCDNLKDGDLCLDSVVCKPESCQTVYNKTLGKITRGYANTLAKSKTCVVKVIGGPQSVACNCPNRLCNNQTAQAMVALAGVVQSSTVPSTASPAEQGKRVLNSSSRWRQPLFVISPATSAHL